MRARDKLSVAPFWAKHDFKVEQKASFLCLTWPVSFKLPLSWKSPLANSAPHQASSHESLNQSQLCRTRHYACLGVLLHPKGWFKVIFTFFFFFFKERGTFPLLFFLSAAACSRGLAVSVWWCNAATVLLQPSRKSQCHSFWAHTSLKQRHLHRPGTAAS